MQILKFSVSSSDNVQLSAYQYVAESSAPATKIFFSHANGFHGRCFDPVIATLVADYECASFDLRGHGASGKPWDKAAYAGHLPWARDVRSVIEQLGVTRPTLVGGSVGGFVAMDYVREFGESAVTGVMLTGSHGGLLPRPVGQPPAFIGDLDQAIEGARTFMKIMSVAPPGAKPTITRTGLVG